MRNLLLILAIALPSWTLANEAIDFDPQPAVEAVEATTEASPSLFADNELIERDIDELFRRVDELERTKIDAAEAEAIAEKVFKRMSLVINKADGGQELKTFDVPISDGTVIKTTLGPGQSFGSLIDPVSGQVVFFGKPNMMNIPNQSQPIEQYQFNNFEVRQSAPTTSGTRTVNLKFGNGPITKSCEMVGDQMVCTTVAPMSDQAVTKQKSRPVWRGLFGNRR